MLLEVITPDETLFKGNVSNVILPGLDGSFGILKGHAPLVSALSQGKVKVDQIIAENNQEEFAGKYNDEFKDTASFTFEVKGGVVEVKDDHIMVLAE